MEMTEMDLHIASLTASFHVKTGSRATAEAGGPLSYAWMAERLLLWSGAMYFFRSL